MRIAIIDLGTNTFNLLIAETLDGGDFDILYNEKLPVKLGEGGINIGIITENAFTRGLVAMETYSAKIREWGVQRTHAFATSAIRSAGNGKEFIDVVEARTGVKVDIINGDREAEYIAAGVMKAVKLSETPSLVIDIGGGSTEFIILDKDGILWKQSFEMGAARLLQKFKPSDPIHKEEIEEISGFLLETLKPLWKAVEKFPVSELIGASGSFESLAEMIAAHYGRELDINAITEFEFDLDECNVISQKILSSTRAERRKMKGLIELRVDMIVVSAILVETVIRHLQISRMRLSSYSLKEGVLKELLDAEGK